MSNDLKLKMEMVPETSWYNNLRSRISKKDWNVLRNDMLNKYNNKCGICGQGGRLDLHEVWHYDDENHIQRLDDLIILCKTCHFVKHMKLSSELIKKGKLTFSRLIEHFKRVNDCDIYMFDEHFSKTLEKYMERSKHNWHIDLGDYKELSRAQNTIDIMDFLSPHLDLSITERLSGRARCFCI